MTLSLVFLAACSTAPQQDAPPTTLLQDGGSSTPSLSTEVSMSDDTTTPDSTPTDETDTGTAPEDEDEALAGCGASVCADYNVVLACTETPSGLSFAEEVCAAGEGCHQGACVAEMCSDACELGDADCELYDLSSGQWVDADADADLHDRARAFEQWMRHDTASIFHGTTTSVRYTGSDLRTIDNIYVGDAALHTGVTLAAEAWRLEATGSAAARAHVRDGVELFHLLYGVAGDPGMLANIAVPAGDDSVRDYTGWDCADRDRHCDVPYDGERWDYIGEPSRDMYVGPLLGLVVAYDALGAADEDLRELIREDVTTTALELIRLRTISVVFEVDGATLPPMNLQTRYFIPEEADQEDGHVIVTIDTGDLDNSGEIRGGQEFYPNPSVLFRQAPLLGWLPDIPRSSSAMMAGAWISAAIHVTEGQPDWQAEHDELEDFYLNNSDEWGNSLDLLEWSGAWLNLRDCGERYFGYNLAMIPLYVWMRTESDAVRQQAVFSQALSPRLWPDVDSHKNAMFSYFYAEAATGAAATSAADDASEQVGLFPAPPRVRSGTNLLDSPNYQDHESGCDDVYDMSRAIDVDDRGPTYFQWHDSPWELVDVEERRQTYPGHDYLVAYWQGRAAGHLTDDDPGQCLRVRP